MKYTLECEREDDGRFLAEVPALPGVLVYGTTAEEAKAKAQALALCVLADQPSIDIHRKVQLPPTSP